MLAGWQYDREVVKILETKNKKPEAHYLIWIIDTCRQTVVDGGKQFVIAHGPPKNSIMAGVSGEWYWWSTVAPMSSKFVPLINFEHFKIVHINTSALRRERGGSIDLYRHVIWLAFSSHRSRRGSIIETSNDCYQIDHSNQIRRQPPCEILDRINELMIFFWIFSELELVCVYVPGDFFRRSRFGTHFAPREQNSSLALQASFLPQRPHLAPVPLPVRPIGNRRASRPHAPDPVPAPARQAQVQ